MNNWVHVICTWKKVEQQELNNWIGKGKKYEQKLQASKFGRKF